MKVIINLEQDVLDKAQKMADKENRSRKKMLELVIQKALK